MTHCRKNWAEAQPDPRIVALFVDLRLFSGTVIPAKAGIHSNPVKPSA
jgi:hypothetical protein